MNSKNLFREHGRAARMPRRMRPLGIAAGDLALAALACAALLGLYALAAHFDEPVDRETEALAIAERAELQAARECAFAREARR